MRRSVTGIILSCGADAQEADAASACRRSAQRVGDVRDVRRRAHRRRRELQRRHAVEDAGRHRCARPNPSVSGTTCSRSSSMSPAARNWLIVAAPPAIEMSPSPAASRACAKADSMPSVTKWNVVPPSISTGSRGWCVSTKTGPWYGGSGPHQPRQSPVHSPRIGPNMLRPMMVAPEARIASISARCSSACSNIHVVQGLGVDVAERRVLALIRAGREAVGRDGEVCVDARHVGQSAAGRRSRPDPRPPRLGVIPRRSAAPAARRSARSPKSSIGRIVRSSNPAAWA